MKKALIWIVCALALVGLIAGASALYSTLGNKYGSDRLDTITPPDNENMNESPTDDDGTEKGEGESNEDHSNPAPDFTVLDKDGNEVKLSDMKGKPVVLNFWATWCPYCVEELPDFNDTYNKYKDRVTFMMLNMTSGSETIEKASAFIDSKGYTFPVYFDTEQQAAYAYSATSLPVTFFVDAEGDLVAYGRGMLTASDLESGIGMILE